MNASHQDRVNDLIEELWDLVEEHEADGPGAVLRLIAERIIAAEDKVSGVVKIKDAG